MFNSNIGNNAFPANPLTKKPELDKNKKGR